MGPQDLVVPWGMYKQSVQQCAQSVNGVQGVVYACVVADVGVAVAPAALPEAPAEDGLLLEVSPVRSAAPTDLQDEEDYEDIAPTVADLLDLPIFSHGGFGYDVT